MTSPLCLLIALGIGMTASTTFAQGIFAPRAEALASFGPFVHDTRGFTSNPAGLTDMRDWDFNAVTSITTGSTGEGFVFNGFGIGKRFLERHALAFQYSPGIALDVVQPATVSVVGVSIPADKKISYAEPVAAAYAWKVSEYVGLGLQARMRTAKVSDPQYQFEIQDSTIVSIPKEFTTTTWLADLGVVWKPAENIVVSAVGRGLLRFTHNGLPLEFGSYGLPVERSIDVALAYVVGLPLIVSLGGSTANTGSVGVEWMPGGGVALRGGIYADFQGGPLVYACAGGLGWAYAFFELDASYLGFTRQENRHGTISSSAFDAANIHDISMNPFTANRAMFSVKAILGNFKESLARIEGVEMFGGIYPSTYEALAYRPIGKAHVRNISKKPIQARVSFFVERLMDQPTETQQTYIAPGGEADIPLTAVFNEQVKRIPKASIHDGTVTVSATVAEDYDDKTQTRVLIHGKNDWDGSAFSLRYFVTPDDPEIIRYSRDVLLQKRDSLESGPKELASFRNARILINAFAGKLSYLSDPKQTADYVQYPSETLKIRGGDCDDMTVCFASLMSSIGISTAFVDVVPPGQPEKSHIYLLFDSGIDPKFGGSITTNPKRYIVRKTKSGQETIWVPVETTVINRGFDAAWTAGAQQYFDDVEVGLGLIKGWVRIVDVF